MLLKLIESNWYLWDSVTYLSKDRANIAGLAS